MVSLRTSRVFFAVAAFAFLTAGTRTSGASETLAAADFEGDSAGDTARPGIPSVHEAVFDDSNCSGGGSQVVSWSGGKRYHLSDGGTSGGRRGIRMPLSRRVSVGTMAVSAVVSAEQTANGGVLSLDEPDESKWIGRCAFGSGGNFVVHGASTSASYTSGHRYLVEMTISFGPPGTVDYEITDLTTSTTVLTSTGHSVETGAEADSLSFSTDTTDDGAFTIDDILAVQ